MQQSSFTTKQNGKYYDLYLDGKKVNLTTGIKIKDLRGTLLYTNVGAGIPRVYNGKVSIQTYEGHFIQLEP